MAIRPGSGTFSYGAAPSTSDLDAVRVLIGDTVEAQAIVSDEEINWFLAQEGSTHAAALGLALALATRFSKEADKEVGDLRIKASQRARNYRSMIALLEARASRAGLTPVPYAGGLSRAERDTDKADSDLVQPVFTVGMHSQDGEDVNNPDPLVN